MLNDNGRYSDELESIYAEMNDLECTKAIAQEGGTWHAEREEYYQERLDQLQFEIFLYHLRASVKDNDDFPPQDLAHRDGWPF